MKNAIGLWVWFLVTVFVVYSFSLNTASAVFSNVIKTSLHASTFQASIATGVFILVYACMQIPAGYLLDRFNSRFVVSSSVFLLALGNIIISFANSLSVFALSNFLQGIGASFAFIAAAVLISQWFSEKNFPIFFGLTQMLSCILTGIIHYYFTYSLKVYSWRDIYRVLGMFGMILFVFILIFLKSPSGYKPPKFISFKTSLGMVFKNNQILLCALAGGISFGVLLAYAGLWYLVIQTYYRLDTLQAVSISGIIFIGIGIGTPIWGWISNLVKSRIMIIHVTLTLGIMILLMGLYLPHYDIPTLIILRIVSFFIGFLLSGSMLFYTVVSEISNSATRGVAISILNTMVFLINIIMLLVPYLFITEISRDFFTYLWVLPFCTLFSLLLVYFIKEPIMVENNERS